MSSGPGHPGPRPNPPRRLAPSLRNIGPYEVIDLLGQGGMAAVYLARDSRDGREVAVKVLARMRPSWVHRFSREFEAAKKVDHPNVVRVLEAGESDGMAYYSMERINGVTASRYVRGLKNDEPLPPPPPMDFKGPTEPSDPEVIDRTLAVAVQLARAVGAIHEVGIVHRDLKPGNVLVTPAGIVKLVDFGVVKWLEELSSFTQVGHVVGSYSYMSPEQITGTQVDHRADMYGMGVLLYELTTGAPPFRARRPQEYLWLHCTAQPDPVSRRLDGIPGSFDALLLRLLSKEPADRPDSMAAVEEELLGILAERREEEAEDMRRAAPEQPAPEPPPSIDEMDPDATQQSIQAAGRREVRPEDSTRPLDKELLDRVRAQQASSEPTPIDPGVEEQETPPNISEPEEERTRPTLKNEATVRHSNQGGNRLGRRTAGSAVLAALVTPKHVGRKPEIDRLMDALRRVRNSGAQCVLVEGEEGLGKTRLVHTFRGLAWVKGARVAIGRCDPNRNTYCAP
ncbi:MAG: serine/threonine-protein kinase, partial [Myxococcota bacterium]|nr:serine/threonine-protein kinase [Myxococcota bacterium]